MLSKEVPCPSSKHILWHFKQDDAERWNQIVLNLMAMKRRMQRRW